MAKRHRATPVQASILRFLHTQGPAWVFIGHKVTSFASGKSPGVVYTNFVTQHMLHAHGLIERLPGTDLRRITPAGLRAIGVDR